MYAVQPLRDRSAFRIFSYSGCHNPQNDGIVSSLVNSSCDKMILLLAIYAGMETLLDLLFCGRNCA